MVSRERLQGFTLVELLVVIAVVAILASIAIVSYNGWQRRTASSVVTSDLLSAGAAMKQAVNFSNKYPSSLAKLGESFTPSEDVSLALYTESSGGQPVYDNLTGVQNAVLFHEVCRQILSEDEYTTLHSIDGTATNTSYNYWCGSSDGVNGINAGYYQINSWNSKQWAVPITKAQLEDRVANPPTDSWWDIATLESKTYRALIDRFEASGGTFPIVSIWDAWAGPTNSGVPKEPLPAPTEPVAVSAQDKYCIVATSQRHPSIVKHITAQQAEPIDGSC